MTVTPVPHHERIVWRGHPSWADHALLFVLMTAAAMRGAFALRSEEWLTATLYASAIGVFLGIAALFHYAWFYEITSRRIRVVSGFNRKSVRELTLDQVSSITVRRELFNSLFDIGSLEAMSQQKGEPLVLKGVPDPEGLRQQVGIRAGLQSGSSKSAPQA
jgi:hypothetical protein